MDKSYKVVTVETIKTGTGKKGPWTLRKVTLEGTEFEPSGFDVVNPGDMVTVSEVQNGDYTNYNYKKVKATVGQPSAVKGSETATVMKTLAVVLLIADKMGIPKEELLEVMEK